MKKKWHRVNTWSGNIRLTCRPIMFKAEVSTTQILNNEHYKPRKFILLNNSLYWMKLSSIKLVFLTDWTWSRKPVKIKLLISLSKTNNPSLITNLLKVGVFSISRIYYSLQYISIKIANRIWKLCKSFQSVSFISEICEWKFAGKYFSVKKKWFFLKIACETLIQQSSRWLRAIIDSKFSAILSAQNKHSIAF